MMSFQVRDGLRAVKNTIEDDCLIPGAGSFEVALSQHLKEHSKSVQGRAKLGVQVRRQYKLLNLKNWQAFAEALLVIPKTLAFNAGQDAMDALINVQDAQMSGLV